jgi:Ohr subfamily peroxiredoxin
MARVLYTAEATVTGGRASGHGRTNDGALDVQLRSPKEMGGEGGGTNPEQLFAVGYAACFESALGVVGRRERVEVGDVSIDSRVSLLPAQERGFKLAVELVDLACGRGGYGLEIAARTGARLIGIDFSAEAVRQAREQARRLGVTADFRIGDLAATGLDAGSADAVLCVDAIHFAPQPDAAARSGGS